MASGNGTSASNGKKSGKKSGGFLVEQPHGGAIRYGSEPGNTPGTGRPPSALRGRMREMLEGNLHIAQEIADDPETTDSDRLRALDFLAKYGLGTKIEHTGEDGGPIELAEKMRDAAESAREKIADRLARYETSG